MWMSTLDRGRNTSLTRLFLVMVNSSDSLESMENHVLRNGKNMGCAALLAETR